MLYDEFIKGIGCRDTEQNFNIYKGLELVYMNTELSKDDIYKMGKKLVNIDELQQTIENMQKWLDMTPYSEQNIIKYYKREIKQAKQQIKQLKECFYK